MMDYFASIYTLVCSYVEAVTKIPAEDFFLALSVLALATVSASVMIVRAFKKHKR